MEPKYLPITPVLRATCGAAGQHGTLLAAACHINTKAVGGNWPLKASALYNYTSNLFVSPQNSTAPLQKGLS